MLAAQGRVAEKSALWEEFAALFVRYDNAMQNGPARVTIDDLPPYSRSLLRIRVPVVVTLAQKRQALSRITELGPGAIIQFDKSCEEMLELEVANKPIALGEAVKVGDKFGLRITSIVLPDERFHAMIPSHKSS